MTLVIFLDYIFFTNTAEQLNVHTSAVNTFTSTNNLTFKN